MLGRLSDECFKGDHAAVTGALDAGDDHRPSRPPGEAFHLPIQGAEAGLRNLVIQPWDGARWHSIRARVRVGRCGEMPPKMPRWGW
jgi:hypothetical protein